MKRASILLMTAILIFAVISCKDSPTAPAVATDTPQPAATLTHTAVFTASATPTITMTPTDMPSGTFTSTCTATPTATETCTATATATATSTATPRLFDHLTITGAGGTPIENCVAGVPFSISITAWADASETSVATAFTGEVGLQASNNYSLSYYCISPTMSINFTSGIAVMSVTMYRAGNTPVYISALFAGESYQSNSFYITAAAPTHLLILPDGVTHRPGLTHVGIPGYQGYEGAPNTQEAGASFNADVILTDNYYNRVTNTAVKYAKITSTDPFAMLDSLEVSSGVYVTMTAGIFSSAGYVLKSTGASYNQKIFAEVSGLGMYASPYIFVRHSTAAGFNIVKPAGNLTAGGEYGLTITAVDQYGNTCNGYNGGTAFDQYTVFNMYYGGAPISTNYFGFEGIYWVGGVARPKVYPMRAGTGCRFAVDSGVLHGETGTFNLNRGPYTRAVLITDGLSLDAGNNAAGYVSGTQANAVAGVPYPISAYGCDYFNNVDTTVNNHYLIYSTVAGDTFDGSPMPVYATMTAGALSGSIIFSGTGTRTVTVQDADNGAILTDARDILVQ